MPPDSTATRARLLEAAFDEFARAGIAGARVDKIAAAAGANKRLLYVYYGNKDQLFETVAAKALTTATEAVPFTPDDLPGYAGRLFDYLVANPAIARLTAWRQLERPDLVSEEERASYRGKVTALGQRDRTGPLADRDPVDVLVLVVGLVGSWMSASPALHALAAEDGAERRAEHRAAVVAAVTALVS